MAGSVFPFCGANSSEDYTAPGAWPFDHQCMIRFPEDLAKRLAQALDVAQQGSKSDSEALDLVIAPVAAKNRRWEVRAYGESLQGTLVDLPRPVESHIIREPGKGDTDTTLYKSADITQLLIVHREPAAPGADVELNHDSFVWSSGLTPYTSRIGARSFRECPFDPKELRETEQALDAWIRGESYKTTRYLDMTDQEVEALRRSQPENIWEPPPEVRPDAGASAETAEDNETRVQKSRRLRPGARKNLLSFGSLAKKRRKLNVLEEADASGSAAAKPPGGCHDWY